MQCSFKVSIIGVGNVGATAAYAMCLDGTLTDLVLVAHHKDKAEAEKLDIEHALPFLSSVNIVATDDYAQVAGSDLVVVTAGAAQKPGETRLDLLKTNLAIFNDIVPKIYQASPESLVLIVTNPVDILTYHSSKLAAFKPGQIFGSGTILDTARFRFHLSESLQVSPRSIHSYVLGEHGDHSFPVVSSATIGGQKLSEFPGYSADQMKDAFVKTQQAAYQIIQAKGATYYAIATAITKIMSTIYSDSHSILPLSVPLTGQFGQSEMALSLPCVVGRQGIHQSINVPLSAEEQAQFVEAATVLKQAYQEANQV